jgi:hypothetical protein
VKNRMLEIGAYGTVRGEGGNILTYSETCALMPRETLQTCRSQLVELRHGRL